MSGEIDGTLVAEVDGVKFYTDGVEYGGIQIQAKIGYFDFTYERDLISNSNIWKVGASTPTPVISVDYEGRVTLDALRGPLDIGVIRYPDGTIGVHGGAHLGGPWANIGVSKHGGGATTGSFGNLSSYDHFEVYGDGTVVNVQYSPGDYQFPYIKVTRTYELPNGVVHSYEASVGNSLLAADMAAGIAPQIYSDAAFWNNGNCFGSGSQITMWPLDAPQRTLPDVEFGQKQLRAASRTKSIEEVTTGDRVVSVDEKGDIVPGYVSRIFQNEAKIILNFHGTRVTPGHVYFRHDSTKKYKFETLIDILRDDGVIQKQDGSLVRASINVPVGHPLDGFVRAITGVRLADGHVVEQTRGRIRLGTRFIVDDSRSYCVADLIKAGGGVVGKDEMIRIDGGEPMPFHWEFSETIPKPEDYVLACSATTLEDIYKVAEWEDQQPVAPAPSVAGGSSIQPMSRSALNAMPRNEPLSVEPVTEVKPVESIHVDHVTKTKHQG